MFFNQRRLRDKVAHCRQIAVIFAVPNIIGSFEGAVSNKINIFHTTGCIYRAIHRQGASLTAFSTRWRVGVSNRWFKLWACLIFITFNISSWSKRPSWSAVSSSTLLSSAPSCATSVPPSPRRRLKFQQVLPQDHRQRRRRHHHYQRNEGVQRLPRIRWKKIDQRVQGIRKEGRSQWTFWVPQSQAR